MQKQKFIGICLAGALLLGGQAWAVEPGNHPELVNPLPIAAPLSPIIDLSVALELKEADELVEYDVRIPQVQGLKDEIFQQQLNQEILAAAQQKIEEIKSQAKESAAMAAQEGWEFRPYTLNIDFSLKENGNILSFRIDNYAYTGGANGLSWAETYNIDTANNQQWQLQDLFKPKVDFITAINQAIADQIKEQEKAEGPIYFKGEMGFQTIGAEQDFYLENGQLVILFQKYEIGPGAMGLPEFKIPLASLTDLLRNGETSREQITFLSFTGTVERVEEGPQFKTLWLKDREDRPAAFVITDATYIVGGESPVVGSEITGFYDPRKPMLMIYPPRYNVEVVAVAEDGQNIQVDSFDADLISSDGFLQLNLAEETKIITRDGAPFTGKLQDEILAVIYGAATKSIPAQTTPYQVVVLGKAPEEPAADIFVDAATMEIRVKGEPIGAAPAYTNEQGTLMVPLRDVGEALGSKVVWDNDTETVSVDGAILKVGQAGYQTRTGEEIKLAAAPAMKNYTIFVPAEFFPFQ